MPFFGLDSVENELVKYRSHIDFAAVLLHRCFMKVQEVVDRVLKDPVYAKQMIQKVSRLTAAGELSKSTSESPDANWQDVMAEFAENPDELAKFSDVGGGAVEGSTTWTATSTTITSSLATVAAPACVTTVTTMTTVRAQ